MRISLRCICDQNFLAEKSSSLSKIHSRFGREERTMCSFQNLQPNFGGYKFVLPTPSCFEEVRLLLISNIYSAPCFQRENILIANVPNPGLATLSALSRQSSRRNLNRGHNITRSAMLLFPRLHSSNVPGGLRTPYWQPYVTCYLGKL